MTLVKFNPTYNDSFNSLVENFFGKTMEELFDSMAFQSSVPAVNIFDNGNSYKIEMAAPGLKKENFSVDVNNNLLTIQYKNVEENKTVNEQAKFIKKEFMYSNFRRSFTLPKNVQVENIQATYQDGVLTVEIPKKEDLKQNNTINISVN